jgi:hypothetical protein
MCEKPDRVNEWASARKFQRNHAGEISVTTIPQAIQDRRDELNAELQKCDNERNHINAEVCRLNERLRIVGAEQDACLAELAGLDLAVAAYAENSTSQPNPIPVYNQIDRRAPNRPEGGAEHAHMRANSSPRATRAPRRDIRGLVLEEVRLAGLEGATVDGLVAATGIRRPQVIAALEYHRDTGDIWPGLPDSSGRAVARHPANPFASPFAEPVDILFDPAAPEPQQPDLAAE